MIDVERTLLEDMYERYHWRCFWCGDAATQRAHIIGNSKANRKRFGNAIIDSPLNWLPACSLACNALMDVGHASQLPDRIAEAIRMGDRGLIEQMVHENIERKTMPRRSAPTCK